MRISVLVFLVAGLAFFARPAKNQQTASTRLVATAVPYASGNIALPIQPPVASWLTGHFGYIIDGGLDLSSSLQNNVWAKYIDSAYIYAPGVYPFNHDFATANGFPNPEDLFLHINQDYTVSPALAWQHLDQFDYFEQTNYLTGGSGSPSQAVNGAFTVTANGSFDVTGTLYDGAHQTTVADRLLLGYAEPFDLINVALQSPRSGGSVSWQYWNGGWSPLALRSDSTSQLTDSGAIQFDPPADWAPGIVNKSRPKYWVRAVVAGAMTPPVLARVYGDDWASHAGTNNIRGWSASAPERLNVGLGNLEYNPNPPAKATARFRYQARGTGMWAPNAMFGNPSDVQNGKPTWATYLLWQWQQTAAATGFKYSGALFDDGGTQPQITSPAVPIESLADLKSGSWIGNILSQFQFMRTQMHTSQGSGFRVGANVSDMKLALQVDFSVNELSGSYPRIGNMPLAEADLFLPGNNPLSSVRSLALWDNQHFGFTEGGVFATVDQGSRTPIALLASYQIEANPNTAMQYNTFSWTYLDTDEYYYWAPRTTTLAEPLAADQSNGSKALFLDDDAAITVPGGPIWTNTTVATSAAQAGNIYGYAFKIGNDVIQPFKDSTNHWHTYTPILGNYPAGTVVQWAEMGHQATDPVPSASNIFYWANHFPAMDVDLGAPDPNGWNKGQRDTAYLVNKAASGNPSGCVAPYDCPEFWRRDFTNAIVISHVFHDGNKPSELTTYGPVVPIPLQGTYYPLRADGTTDPGITQLQLRAGEAAILMKTSVKTALPRPRSRAAGGGK